MKNLKNKLILILLVFVGNSLANNPPDGVSSQQWGKIRQQIAASKYYPQADKAGFYTAHNVAQNWQLHYAKNGMTTIKNNDYSIGMKLQSIGSLRLDTTPRIEVKDDTLYYHHSPKIKEWWVNSADKIEQWFSIKQRPITGNHELKVQIELDTDTQVSQSGNQLTFTNHKGQSINYDKLKVWDSRGTVLASRMQLADNQKSFYLIVDDRQAKYPITIDPSFSQTHYIKPLVIDSSDWFGYSVDIDGDIMVIGTPFEDSSSTLINGDDSDNSASTSGAAYVFVHNGSDWVQQAYLKASNAEANDKFGESVSISGTTIAIGAAKEGGDSTSTVTVPNNNQPSAGAVYVFTRSSISTWSQQAYLKAHETGNDEFGSSVAIDGNTIVVGSKLEDGNANSTVLSTNNGASQAGAAYVFTRIGTTWSQQAYLKASNADADDQFGFSVGLNGNTIVVGANQEAGDANSTMGAFNNDASDAGAVYVFFRLGNFWIQQAYLKANNTEAEDEFGYSVAIDGDNVVVGAYLEDGDDASSVFSPNNNAIDAGAAYVFARSSNTWSQQAYLKAGNAEADDVFGISVAIAGETIVIGAVEEDGDATSTMEFPNNNLNIAFENKVGAAYVYSHLDANWIQTDYLKASNADRTQYFGTSVAIGNGYIVVGADGEDGDANSTMGFPNVNAPTAGAVYVYTENTYSIGGTVSGLTAAGLVLQNNSVDDLNITSNGGFTFISLITDGNPYSVSILSQPNGQTCSVSNASGTVAGVDVTDVQLTCTDNTYFVGGSVSGLTGTLVLQNNNSDDLTITTNGSFTFTNPITDGNPYAVTVLSQPNGQTCSVTNGSGTATANVANVELACTTNTYFVGGSVNGLTAAGLVLQNNGTDDLSITNNGVFVFSQPLVDNSNYAVTVTNQPNNQNCVAINTSGTIASNDVVNVGINCTDNSYIIGVSVGGLTSAGLVLQNNGGDDLSISGNGNTPFSTQLIDGSSYNVSILSQPNDPSNVCILNGTHSGTVAGEHVLLSVACGNNDIFNDGFE